jgi:hypothetical protein
MKDDAPHGSVFGGYGFFSYVGTRNKPSAGNGTPAARQSSTRPGLRQRLLQLSSGTLLSRRTRS